MHTLHRALHDGRKVFPGADGRLPIRPFGHGVWREGEGGEGGLRLILFIILHHGTVPGVDQGTIIITTREKYTQTDHTNTQDRHLSTKDRQDIPVERLRGKFLSGGTKRGAI